MLWYNAYINFFCTELVVEINSLKVLATSIPGRYATAVFREARRSGCLDEIAENFKRLEIFFKNHEQIKKLLTVNCISDKDLDTGWLAVGSHLSFCPIFISFLRQLAKNRRFNILARIKYIYTIALAKYKNKRNVAVISAVELLPEQKERIEKVIEKLFREKTIITYKINTKILGGVKVASEEIVYDASVRTRLKQMISFLNKVRV